MSLILDSGAFSAWNSGTEIDLRAYADFVNGLDAIDSAFNLDVIPSDKKQTETAAARGYDNWLELRERCPSTPIVPVFHYGEDFKWLDRYVREGDGRVGLGFSWARGNRAAVRKFTGEVFTSLCVGGRPVVKLHGLGVHALDHIRGFPWASVDTSSWAASTGLGTLSVIRAGTQVRVPVGKRQATWELTLSERRWLSAYVRRWGFSLAELREDWFARWRYGAEFYKSLERDRAGCHRPSGFFGKGRYSDLEAIEDEGTKVYLAMPRFGFDSYRVCRDHHRHWLASYYTITAATSGRKNFEGLLSCLSA